MYVLNGMEYYFDPKPGYILHISKEIGRFSRRGYFWGLSEGSEIEVIEFKTVDSIFPDPVYITIKLNRTTEPKLIRTDRYGWIDGMVPAFRESAKRRVKRGYYEYYVEYYEYYVDFITDIKIQIV